MVDLRTAFTNEQIAFCATLGEGTASLNEKITKLFSELPDPLLSQAEIRDLLRTESTDEEHILALDRLCKEGTIEASENTQRPLDTEKNLKLYRQKLPTISRLKIAAI